MSFASPWALVLLAVLPLAWWWSGRPGRRSAAVYPDVSLLEGVRRTARVRLAWVPSALLLAGSALLVVALARPREGVGEVRTSTDGVALMIVIDRSGSMRLPMRFDGGALPRIDVVKRVFREFVEGNGRDLGGRGGDLIGLVSFARFAETVCPLTTSHGMLVRLVDRMELAGERWEDGTAIGDGLALAAARLRRAEEELAERNRGRVDPAMRIRSKAIVLLTDGDENYGDMPAPQAARLCAEWGIRVYVIGIGDDRGGVVDTPTGRVRIPAGGGFDERTMRKIAEVAGGSYWRATDEDALRRAYEAIDRLEKTEIRSVEFTSYRELFPPLVLAGAACVGVSLLLSSTWLRRGP